LLKAKAHILVSFPDFENINTYGDSLPEALKNAAEALNGVLESDFERGFSIPEPKDISDKRHYAVTALPHLEIAYMLRKLRKGKSQMETARSLGISYQTYQKLENPRKCNPTIKTLEKISAVLGRKSEVSFV
jgi:antitoxin HicB